MVRKACLHAVCLFASLTCLHNETFNCLKQDFLILEILTYQFRYSYTSGMENGIKMIFVSK